MNGPRNYCFVFVMTCLLGWQFVVAVAAGQELLIKAEVDSKIDPRFDKALHQRWVDFYQKEAASYNFYLGPDKTKKLQFKPSPVLLYTNPVGARGLTHGAVFVWTLDGRTEVVGAIWSHANTPGPNQRTVAHEFHSLSESSLRAERDEEIVWSTTQPGVRWSTIPGAAKPGASKAIRLVEMRRIARGMSAERYGEDDRAKTQLRLLPQPLYRYDRTAPADGALFAYCQVWDPEFLLVIESYETERDGQQWRYAPIRFSHLTLSLHHNQKEVWRDARGGPGHVDPALGYKLRYRTSVEDEAIELESAVVR